MRPLGRPVSALTGGWEARVDDAPDWEAISLPHQWFPATPRVVAYRRRIEALPPSPGWEAWLVLDAVDDQVEVRLDGEHRGRAAGQGLAQAIPLGPLTPGWHAMQLEVAAPPEVSPRHLRHGKGALSWHPTRPGGLHASEGLVATSGGLLGDVRLEWRPARHVAGVRAHARFGEGRARVLVDVRLGGPLPPTAEVVDLTLWGPAGERVASLAAPVSDGLATAVLDVPEPQRWWPWDLGEQPLYRLEARLGEDLLARPLGLREVRRDDHGFHVNGVRTFLRGVHHVPALFAAGYGAAEAAADVQLARDAGANVVRLHAHVAPAAFYDACDAAGLMIWQDLPFYGPQADDAAATAGHLQRARAVVAALADRPSVVAFTALTDGGETAAELAPLLVDAIAAEDRESRPVVPHAPLAGRATVGDVAAIAHLAAPLVHAVGAQALPGVEALRALLPPGAAWPPDWQAWAHLGFDYAQAFYVAGLALPDDPAALVAASQAHQAAFLRDALDHLRRARFAPVEGVFAWMLAEPWAGLGWGVLDHARTPKEGYYALAEAFQPLYPSLRLPAGKHRAGLALRPDLLLINDRPTPLDDVVVTLSIAGPDGIEKASVASIPLHVPADGCVQAFPDAGDPLPTHPAWRGPYWLECVVRRHHRPLARALRMVELAGLPDGLAGYRSLG